MASTQYSSLLSSSPNFLGCGRLVSTHSLSPSHLLDEKIDPQVFKVTWKISRKVRTRTQVSTPHPERYYGLGVNHFNDSDQIH